MAPHRTSTPNNTHRTTSPTEQCNERTHPHLTQRPVQIGQRSITTGPSSSPHRIGIINGSSKRPSSGQRIINRNHPSTASPSTQNQPNREGQVGQGRVARKVAVVVEMEWKQGMEWNRTYHVSELDGRPIITAHELVVGLSPKLYEFEIANLHIQTSVTSSRVVNSLCSSNINQLSLNT